MKAENFKIGVIDKHRENIRKMRLENEVCGI